MDKKNIKKTTDGFYDKKVTKKVVKTTATQKNNSTQTLILFIFSIIVVGILSFCLGTMYTMVSAPEKVEETEQTASNIDTKPLVTDLEVTFIGDKRCKDCGNSDILNNLKQIPTLGEFKSSIKDFSDEGVSAMLDAKGIKFLPAIIFSNNDIPKETGLLNYLTKLTDGTYSLALGSKFDPKAEICDNGIDDTNNGAIDCKDSTCSNSMSCRVEEKKKLTVYTMGYCPFGEFALKTLPALKKNFEDNIDIDIHYIATKKGDGYTAADFQSLHGVSEAEENIRQLCINKHYGFDNLLKYITKRYENANNRGQVSDDPSLAIKAFDGDSAKITTCVTGGEGGKMLEEDIKIAQGLGVSASPTWLANNKYQFGGIKLENIQKSFCKYNKELEGCKTTITTTTETKSEGAGQPSCG